jgi:hypothetical protein
MRTHMAAYRQHMHVYVHGCVYLRLLSSAEVECDGVSNSLATLESDVESPSAVGDDERGLVVWCARVGVGVCV